MNYGISLLFRAIPLAMALFCFAYGTCITLSGDDPSRLTAGPVIFFLGSICVALYTAAATIIRQIIGTYTTSARYILPTVGYAFALLTLVCGLFVIYSGEAGACVAGHAICGLGLITACAATVTVSSSRFTLIPRNSADTAFSINAAGFSAGQAATLTAIPAILAAGAWLWTILLFSAASTTEHTAAGSFMLGIACICTSLIAPAAGIARQARGSYTLREKSSWTVLTLGMGSIAFVFGLIMLLAHGGEPIGSVGYILIGLALICWSISDTALLLAKTWHAEHPRTPHIPILPVVTTLCCLFLAAFLFEGSFLNGKFFVPARLLTGFGAVCFALFPIAAILESKQTSA